MCVHLFIHIVHIYIYIIVLAAYGWKVLERTLPVPLEEIENQEYANSMRNR